MKTILLAALIQLVLSTIFFVGLEVMMGHLNDFQLRAFAISMLIGSIIPLLALNTILYGVIYASLRFIKSTHPVQQVVLTSILFSILASAIILSTDHYDGKALYDKPFSLLEWFLLYISWSTLMTLIFAFFFVRHNQVGGPESPDEDHDILDR